MRDIPAGLSRRQLLRFLGFSAAASSLGAAPAYASPERLMARATSTAPAGSDLGAIEHVVFLMMENRSYDHYFGAYPRGRGFDDHPARSLGNFAQAYPGATTLNPPNVLLPFRLQPSGGEECTNDLTHDWGPMHQCWNNATMDSFVKVHTSSAHEGADGAMTMGYYTRAELPFYYAVADNFTLCDNYHASIIGPTHPNRLMSYSGTIDPDGLAGGPVTDTNAEPTAKFSLSWKTVQEHLQDANIPWKVYHPTNTSTDPKYTALANYPTWADALYNPTANAEVLLATDNVLPYFKNFELPSSPLYQNAFLPTFPNDFVSDIANDTLPSVSWVIPPLGFDEHPSASPSHGMYFTSLVLDALMANEKVWSKTVFFLMYDENDGWFDHVSPPFAPPGTPGEHLTAASPATTNSSPDTGGFNSPLGLGVRVPMLVMSPFSRGGHIASEVFDHTSQLRFLEERFGISVPLISQWRRDTVGDLTSTLFQGAVDLSMPALPAAPLTAFDATGTCAEQDQETESGGSKPLLPTGEQMMPTQDGRLIPASYFTDDVVTTAKSTTKASAPEAAAAAKKPAKHAAAAGKRSSTRKSSYNRLAEPTGTLAYTGGIPEAGTAAALVAAGAAAVLIRKKLAAEPDVDVTAG